MKVKFKIPQIDKNIRWLLDWKIPYFPTKNDKILISSFLSEEINKHLLQLTLSDWVDIVEAGEAYYVPDEIVRTIKIKIKDLEEEKKNIDIKSLFVDSQPCIINDLVWLRSDNGELQAYLEIYLDFSRILDNL